MPPPSHRPDGTGDLAALAHAFANAEEVRAIQRGYLRFFDGARRVLDLGCGRGIFLDLLREAGIEGLGVDTSERCLAECRSQGHSVMETTAGQALRELVAKGDQFGGIFLSHVVEHMTPTEADALLRDAVRVLAPKGRLVVVTPNARNLLVVTEFFWLDPTHVRPYPRALLEAMGSAAGLRVTDSFDDPATVPRRPPLRRWLVKVRSLLSGADRSGPLDSVVVLATD